MSMAITSQVIIILLSLYFIVRALRKMPKAISYSVYGFMLVTTATIFFMGFYYPETLQQFNDTLLGWQEKLRMS